MLDDQNVLKQRDPNGALDVAYEQIDQLKLPVDVHGKLPSGKITEVVVCGMGGSALAADLAKSWLTLKVPFEVVRGYDLPAYVGKHTLVIATSHSGNTEETISAYKQILDKNCCAVVIASGGELIELAQKNHTAYLNLPTGIQPRMAVLANLKMLVGVFERLKLVKDQVSQLEQSVDWLHEEAKAWIKTSDLANNPAKRLALEVIGKTPIVYGGQVTGTLANKWKIGFNENAKNVAFAGVYPEFNHNEFIGWSSHPIEKPFKVIDLLSSFENPRILKRFELSDRLLSGLRPKAQVIHLKGETEIQQLLWGLVYGDFISIYTAILNGVNPTPVGLVERLKEELRES